MIEARVAGPDLEVELTGFPGWMTTLRPRWTFSVPLEHVLGAQAAPPRPWGWRRYANAPGSDRRHWSGQLICARFRAPTLRIELDTYPYHEIILSVPDPERTAGEIQQALRSYRR